MSKTGYSIGRERLRIYLSIFLCVLIIYLLFRRIDFYKFASVFKEINVYVIYLAILVSLVSIGLGAYKWQILLKIMQCDVPFREILFISLGNAPLRLVLPLKTGALALAGYLKKYKGFPFTNGASSIMLDKVYNLLATVFFMPLGLMFFDFPVPYRILGWLLFLLIFYIVFYLFSPLLRRFLNAISPKLGNLYEDVHHMVMNMTIKQKLYLFAFAVIFQGLTVMTTYLIFRALNISVPFYWLLLFVPLIILITHIPITVFGLGTREAAVLFFYSRFASTEPLLSAGILMSLIKYILIAFLGCFFMYSFTRRLLP